MTLLRVVTGDAGPVLRTQRTYLRAPIMADHLAWSEVRAASRDFLRPWEPTWPEDDLTRAAFRRRIKRYQRESREDSGYPFFLFRAIDGQIIGGATLSNVRRGVAQTCSLGYWMGAEYAGQGYMGEAVRALVPFVFNELRLHRIEAASMPHNARSIALLESAGFVREGMARRYLLIDGRWQDHILFGMVADDGERW